MGSLTPNKQLIYESVGDKIYAREKGSLDRVLIGYNLPKRRDPLQYDWVQTQLWQDIVEAGKSNPSLQKVLDRAILIYQTIKDKDDK